MALLEEIVGGDAPKAALAAMSWQKSAINMRWLAERLFHCDVPPRRSTAPTLQDRPQALPKDAQTLALYSRF
jgi:hypothetical protein